MRSLSIYLPTRKSSQRAPEKNTRKFSGVQGGLLELKLKELVKLEMADEIILSSNDERSLEIGRSFQKRFDKIRLEERPEHLAASYTSLTDLIEYAGKLAKGDDILWTHVTSPFCGSEIYRRAVKQYYLRQQDFDSLVGVRKFQNFLWDPEAKDLINRLGRQKWPPTQELRLLYEISNAVFIAPKQYYLEHKDRLGVRPFLFEMEKIPSLDIDDEEDFKIAEGVYERIYR